MKTTQRVLTTAIRISALGVICPFATADMIYCFNKTDCFRIESDETCADQHVVGFECFDEAPIHHQTTGDPGDLLATVTDVSTGATLAVLSNPEGFYDLEQFVGTPIEVVFTHSDWPAEQCSLTSLSGVHHNLQVVPNLIVGTRYCQAVPNSTGAQGVLGTYGSDVASDNQFTLVASSLPDDAFGYFLVSSSQGFLGQPGGSVGNLCLSASIGRYTGPGQVQSSGEASAFHLQVDLLHTPLPGGSIAVQPGDTWNFQHWYRDPAGGGFFFNLSDAITIQLAP